MATVTGLPALVLTQEGLDPSAYREPPLERRTAGCLRAIRAKSAQHAAAQLRGNRELSRTALSALLIGVSEFFRDPPVFDMLQSQVVPSLAQRTGTCRVLSIGCSTGAELYGVGILLKEADLLFGAELHGIDCREDAIDEARGGVFAASALAGVSPERLARDFAPVANGWRIADALRERTRWYRQDAIRELPGGPWDLVLCRNMFIYLQPHVADAIVDRIVHTLSPGGFLVVGRAERQPAGKLATLGHCIYRKHVS